MEIRNPMHPDHLKLLTTDSIRKEFLIENLFTPDSLNLTYSHIDRIIAGGVSPVNSAVELVGSTKELGVDFFLQRRELGIINIGGKGTVTVDGKPYILGKKDCLYVGMGAKNVLFTSADTSSPAKFYLNSAPAHHTYDTILITQNDARKVNMGSADKSNVRTIYQYIHPEVMKSCQLVMGLTSLEPNNMWNSMPCHTHERRMEVYLYFDLPDDAVVFHLMGQPTETRHIVMHNEQAVISPSWSIHSGVGTSNYSFIWGMVGENQTFTDMDHVKMMDIR